MPVKRWYPLLTGICLGASLAILMLLVLEV
jgi:hypothetical protein